MLDLESAIKHCEEVAEKNESEANFGFGNVCIDRSSCLECAKEHRQLATWLKELKQLRGQMSHSEKPNKWIPISESIPPLRQKVLVCDLDGDMHITYLHLNGTWGFDYCGNKIKNVVAWQELPAPYKAESEDKDD